MKEIIHFECADGKSYELFYDVRRLRRLEESLNCAFFDFFSQIGNGSLRGLTLDFTIKALQFAVGAEGEDEAISIIEAHSDNGGVVDDINSALLKAAMATGLFIPRGKGSVMEAETVDED